MAREAARQQAANVARRFWRAADPRGAACPAASREVGEGEFLGRWAGGMGSVAEWESKCLQGAVWDYYFFKDHLRDMRARALQNGAGGDVAGMAKAAAERGLFDFVTHFASDPAVEYRCIGAINAEAVSRLALLAGDSGRQVNAAMALDDYGLLRGLEPSELLARFPYADFAGYMGANYGGLGYGGS